MDMHTCMLNAYLLADCPSRQAQCCTATGTLVAARGIGISTLRAASSRWTVHVGGDGAAHEGAVSTICCSLYAVRSSKGQDIGAPGASVPKDTKP